MTDAAAPVDVLVVGAGVAGAYAAVCAASEGARVALICSNPLTPKEGPESGPAREEISSDWAQGGLAAALAPEDSPAKHLQDTIAAGRRLVRPSAAALVCEDAPARVRHLQELGVQFDHEENGELIVALEGGHSLRRVVHVDGSQTGWHILNHLKGVIRGMPNIVVRDRTSVHSLLRNDEGECVGIGVDDDGENLLAPAVILATGGAAALWSRTTNPIGSVGAGLLLAYSVGAQLADLEFVQFHPTAVIGVDGLEGFLITEAARGEGATLLDVNGNRFVDELQPRDVVARAIQSKLAETRTKAVYLDMRAIAPKRFPNINKRLRQAGLDPAKQLIPVAPAAHYTIGGVATDLDGHSTVTGLYAVGECSCTGLHGANRLASNSLSECLVLGRRAALSAINIESKASTRNVIDDGEPLTFRPTSTTRHALWRHAGLERNATGLANLLDDAHPLARLVAKSALAREETRGAHLRTDFPETRGDLDTHHTVVMQQSKEASFDVWT